MANLAPVVTVNVYTLSSSTAQNKRLVGFIQVDDYEYRTVVLSGSSNDEIVAKGLEAYRIGNENKQRLYGRDAFPGKFAREAAVVSDNTSATTCDDEVKKFKWMYHPTTKDVKRVKPEDRADFDARGYVEGKKPDYVKPEPIVKSGLKRGQHFLGKCWVMNPGTREKRCIAKAEGEKLISLGWIKCGARSH